MNPIRYATGRWAVVGVLAAATAEAVVVPLAGPAGEDIDAPVIRWTAWAAVGWWAGAVGLGVGRPAANPRWPIARGLFLLGWWQFLLHVVLAFHLGHGWSHAAAVYRVESVSGFGPGIWGSHLFLLVWTVEAAGMAFAPGGYRRRPRWVGWAVGGFMAFIVFNATVVYGSWPAKLFGAAAFTGIGWARVRTA